MSICRVKICICSLEKGICCPFLLICSRNSRKDSIQTRKRVRLFTEIKLSFVKREFCSQNRIITDCAGGMNSENLAERWNFDLSKLRRRERVVKGFKGWKAVITICRQKIRLIGRMRRRETVWVCFAKKNGKKSIAGFFAVSFYWAIEKQSKQVDFLENDTCTQCKHIDTCVAAVVEKVSQTDFIVSGNIDEIEKVDTDSCIRTDGKTVDIFIVEIY